MALITRRSSMGRTTHSLAGPYRDRQTIFAWRIRAVVAGVVVAERMKRAVEIEIVEARRGSIELEVSAARIGFRSVRQIAEGDEQMIDVLLTNLDERRQGQQASLERERQLPNAIVSAALAPRCWNFDHVV